MLDNDSHDIGRRTVLRGVGALGGLSLAGVSIGSRNARALSEPPAGEGVLLQVFHRKWTTIEERIPEIAGSGFDAIWIQQPAASKLGWEDLSYDGKIGFYDEVGPYGHRDPHPPIGYQPVDLRNFDSALGTEAELERLIGTAHDHGIEVIVDVVLNHMAAPDGPDGTVEWPQFDTDEHFHDNGTLGDDCELEGEAADYECDLLGLPSLDVSHPDVQAAHEAYIERIAGLGADGLRYDAAAHVWPWYFAEHVNPLADDLGLWRVAEVWEESDVEGLVEWADTGMTVFDFPLYSAIADAFDGGSLADLSRSVAPGVAHRDPDAAVTFVQNHDAIGPGVEPTDDAATVPEGRAVELAEAFVLAYAGRPKIYRSGPEEYHELADDDLATLVGIADEHAEGYVVDRAVSEDYYVFERDGSLLAGINTGEEPASVTVDTAWRGTDLSDATGTGDLVAVGADGEATIEIPARGYVMYVADCPPTEPTVSFRSLEYAAEGGETATIDAVVRAGREDLYDDLTVSLSGETVASERVCLGARESMTVTFEVDTDRDEGEYELIGSTPDDADVSTLIVREDEVITLRIEAPTAPDESVYFTGSSEELTDWGEGIEGNHIEGEIWEVTLEDSDTFAWKTRRGPEGEGGDVWEGGENHSAADRSPDHQGWEDGFDGGDGGGSEDEGEDEDGDGEITLRTTVEIKDGESVYFTGSPESLTEWGGGVEATRTEDEVWAVTIDDPGTFEWKTRRGPEGEDGDVWEAGENHDEDDRHPDHQGWEDE
ncbi:alpha-amylase family glycosyl hydrolase [Saliphagus infecundisoli]|uniref:Alpha-amylase family glycosyl hydrolase n=1 Tax=Saliphagus infecundisoli TaxID=1849069 RepID=A0ABD5QHS3_9EURY|nr:alpha-amylase family glycosyl hydrolase [Saliphagus infecundisoli]